MGGVFRLSFKERFALGQNRAEELSNLAQGTKDYFVYNLLHLLEDNDEGKNDEKIVQLLTQFERNFRDAKSDVQRLRVRHFLSSYSRSTPETQQSTLKWFVHELALSFTDSVDRSGVSSDGNPSTHPTRLDPKEVLAFQNLDTSSLQLSDYTSLGKQRLAKVAISAENRRAILREQTFPTLENLVELILDDFKSNPNTNFGDLGIHHHLTLEQLQFLRTVKPDLIDQSAFVQSYLKKLSPEDGTNIFKDTVVTKQYLQKLSTFVSELTQVFNSYKSLVLYYRLQIDQEERKYDENLFLEYLAIPRSTQYANPAHLEGKTVVYLGKQSVGLLPAIADDWSLVSNYLKHFFSHQDRNDIKPFQHYIEDTTLRKLFAETKLLSGNVPDQSIESLRDMLGGATALEALKQEVILEFTVDNKKTFTVKDRVKLSLNIKNVSALIVKVFEVNTTTYYKKTGREVDNNINLDGLVAKHEEVHNFKEPPLKRVRKDFEFNNLSERGVFVFEFIGSGKSVRAVVWKGQLRLISRLTTVGNVLNVIDENNAVLNTKETTVWLSGHIYQPKENGDILVPFKQGDSLSQTVVVSHGSFSSLASFVHYSEEYTLSGGFYVDRESLLKINLAKVVVRANLYLNQTPVQLEKLEEVKLEITCQDKDNTITTKEVKDFQLYTDKESEYEFLVPENSRHFRFKLQGKVKYSSRSDEVVLNINDQFGLNEIDTSNIVEDVHLARYPDGYKLYVLGKSGEPKPHYALGLGFQNKYLNSPKKVQLQSDDQGVIHLGELAEIQTLTVQGVAGKICTRKWELQDHGYHHTTNRIHALNKQTLFFPYSTASGEVLSRERAALFKLVEGNVIAYDYSSVLSVRDGYLVVDGDKLTTGNYKLVLLVYNEIESIDIIFFEAAKKFQTGNQENLIYSEKNNEVVELNAETPAQISAITIHPSTTEQFSKGEETIEIKVSNPTPKTRIHCFCSVFIPEYSTLESLIASHPPSTDPSRTSLPAVEHNAHYSAARALSAEQRYILDRRYAKKRHGNMLPPPSLLLNPRVATGLQRPVPRASPQSKAALCSNSMSGRGRGGVAARKCSAMGYMDEERMSHDDAIERRVANYTSNIDFIPYPSRSALNLKVNEGSVKINRKQLQFVGTYLRVVLVDEKIVSYQDFTLPAVEPNTENAQSSIVNRALKLKHKDLRLNEQALNPTKYYNQQRQIDLLKQNEKFHVHDLASAQVEIFDNLAKAFRLLNLLNSTDQVQSFDWLVRWESLNEKDKLEKYSKYASHELNFFVYHKDENFFNSVVKPFLRNKKDKTFLDFWLLNENEWLELYLLQQHFDTLNTAERLLLAQRLKENNKHPEQVKGITKSILDSFAALKANPAEFDRIFKIAIKSSGLDSPSESEDRYTMPVHREEIQSGGFYEQIGLVKQWGETNYYGLETYQQTPDLVKVNAFWNDFAHFIAHEGPSNKFVSKNFAYAYSNLTEIVFTLSLLNIPSTATKHETTYDQGSLNLVAGSPAVVFHQQISESSFVNEPSLLVNQIYWDPHDPTTVDEDGDTVNKYVTEEFLVSKMYASEVVITNISKSKQKLSVLLQIPVGAIPLKNGFFTESKYMEIEAGAQREASFFFYFPTTASLGSGWEQERDSSNFVHFGAQVSKKRNVVSTAQSRELKVVKQLSKVDAKSWHYVSQYGTNEEILSFLNNENLSNRVDLTKICWKVRTDKQFFEQVLETLKRRFIYHRKLWSYSFFHNSEKYIKEFLQREKFVLENSLPLLDSDLVQLNGLGNTLTHSNRHLHSLHLLQEVQLNSFEYFEYFPLINPRVHAMNDDKVVINDARFQAKYEEFIDALCYKKRSQFDAVDHLVLSYYLVLQDRISEALEFFQAIPNIPSSGKDLGDVHMRLQYDYLAAYFDFFNDKPTIARSIAQQYANFPVTHWNKKFKELQNQLDEIDGKPVVVDDDVRNLDRDQRMAQFVASESSFEFQIEKKEITIAYTNLSEVTLSYFVIDLELLFSLNPFIFQDLDQMGVVIPNRSEHIQLPNVSSHLQYHKVPIAAEFHNSNFVVLISGRGSTQSKVYYSHSLTVQLFENYGQLKVTDNQSNNALPKVYIKVYSKSNGQVQFYKDGYTDLRGRFDYASQNGDALSNVSDFRILILSESHGAVIKEAKPPHANK